MKKKTQEMLIDFSHSENMSDPIKMNGQQIQRVSSAKLLGLTISDDLSWNLHIKNITSKSNQRLYCLRLLKRAKVSIDKLIHMYCAIVRPNLEYACQVWHGSLDKELCSQVESVQERALNIIMPDANYDLALQISGLPTLETRRREMCQKLFIEMQNSDHKLHHLLPPERPQFTNFRSTGKYEAPIVKTDRRKNSFVNWCLFNLQ